MRRLGLLLLWGGVGVVAAYLLLLVLGRWGVEWKDLYGGVRGFFTSPRIPLAVRLALPAILLGTIIFLASRGKSAKGMSKGKN